MLELVLGCMMSGKTTEACRRAERHALAGSRVGYYSPASDTRSSELVNHSKTLRVSCRKVDSLREVLKDLEDVDVFCIDEIQFFCPDEIHAVFSESAIRRKLFICAGLNGDSSRRPWPAVSAILPLADKIDFYTAVCRRCGELKRYREASFTRCKLDKTNQIVIGGEETYEAVCGEHYWDD